MRRFLWLAPVTLVALGGCGILPITYTFDLLPYIDPHDEGLYAVFGTMFDTEPLLVLRSSIPTLPVGTVTSSSLVTTIRLTNFIGSTGTLNLTLFFATAPADPTGQMPPCATNTATLNIPAAPNPPSPISATFNEAFHFPPCAIDLLRSTGDMHVVGRLSNTGLAAGTYEITRLQIRLTIVV